MFDVSFSELLVIVVVALVVIGPEKLPKVARTLGAISGRMQRYVAQVKEEVNRESRFDALQTLQSEIKAGVDKMQHAARDEVAQLKAVQVESVNIASANAESIHGEIEPTLRMADDGHIDSHVKNITLPADTSGPNVEKLVKKRVRKTVQ